jgi:hypothetical protein
MRTLFHEVLPKVFGSILATNTRLPKIRIHPGPRRAPHAVTNSLGQTLGGRAREGPQQQAPALYRAGTNLSRRELQVGQ